MDRSLFPPSSVHNTFVVFVCGLFIIMASFSPPFFANAHSQSSSLSPSFYSKTCPSVFRIVKSTVDSAVQNEARMAASLLRLHFHDCFVNGCDGSVLLDDTATMAGEKHAPPNNNSLRGFEVVDAMKAAIEEECPGVVSCADILAIAARDAVVAAGGPSWRVHLGRRDSLTANYSAAIAALPSPNEPLSTIVEKFAELGLSELDLASLSGGHSFGRARCSLVASRLYNFSASGSPDPTLDASYLQVLQAFCGPYAAASSSSSTLDLDLSTPDRFDNKFYRNLQSNKGLLASDQAILSTPGAATVSYVTSFAADQDAFFAAFAKSMVKMGNIEPLTGSQGQIRVNCHVVN